MVECLITERQLTHTYVWDGRKVTRDSCSALDVSCYLTLTDQTLGKPTLLNALGSLLEPAKWTFTNKLHTFFLCFSYFWWMCDFSFLFLLVIFLQATVMTHLKAG